ncbi:MAG: hypothetical protein K8W52_29470 [Deltaproteobacteria bacterium]|nr:hypothetical protein [Deltaproteobacteria bacterium]
MRLVLVALAVAALAAEARADVIGRPLVLAPGSIEGGVAVETNLAPRRVGKALSIAPDVLVGVTPRLTLGIVHSARALGLVATGDGLCLGGIYRGCNDAYKNLALDARWSIRAGRAGRAGGFALAAHGRALVRRFDPLLPSVRVGALARWRRGAFEVASDPYLQLGLWHRDRGNRAVIGVPLWLAVAPTCRWALYLHTGVRGEVAVFGDAWAVPIAVGTRVAVTPRVDVSAEGGFERLGGPLNTGNLRSAWIAVDLRWP